MRFSRQKLKIRPMQNISPFICVALRFIFSYKFAVVILSCLLVKIPTAYAELIEIGRSDKFITYIDSTTFYKNGNLRRIWQLRNYSSKDADGIVSSSARIEYNCLEDRYRILTLSTHDMPNAKGRIITLDNQASQWLEIPPRTATHASFKLFCSM